MPKKTTFLHALATILLVSLIASSTAFAGAKKREKRAAQWPAVDLASYSTLYIEDFRITDPKAGKRKQVVLVKSAAARMADYVRATMEPGLFDEIKRQAVQPTPGAVALRVEITKYKPGSALGRAMLAGVGSAHLDFKAALVDAQSGEKLTSFSGNRTWGWGGAYGASKGIADMEQNLAYEMALYLGRCKGKTADGEPGVVGGS